MAMFGKRETGGTTPDWGRREDSFRIGGVSRDDRPAGGPTPEELERVLRWRKLVKVLPGLHWTLAACIGLACMGAPLLFLVLAMIPGIQYVGMAFVLVFVAVVVAIKCATLYGQFVISQHERRYPSGFLGYMRKTPIVFVLGIMFALVWFGYFSGHDLSELYTDFTFKKMLALDGHGPNERGAWMEFCNYVIWATLGTGAIFYALDKYSGRRTRSS